MNRILKIAFVTLLFLGLNTSVSLAKEKSALKTEEISAEDKIRLEEIESRVNEIKAMDFTGLTKEERKEVRSELRELKKEAQNRGNGLYISTGALIVILILLIILL
ncbi:hypothetical protein ACFOUP_14500 [Belliella kenyensis]|uniref:Seryl-tRNA synthetase n=1 Tax=Belliella kenyensis TaxID=1472724 RepID=A0ABV8EMQ0_9BACT|nr:hypothetical protein [Belliella kenyensis]MCH7401655.1 hypothetical protein [Belliella kenyensis]MDN3603067.1 hypothetical protein [Belliella kenyensis]